MGGRIAVLAYHSLEDRMVKRELALGAHSSAPPDLPVELPQHAPYLRLLTRGAEVPDDDELADELPGRPPRGCGPRNGPAPEGAQHEPDPRGRGHRRSASGAAAAAPARPHAPGPRAPRPSLRVVHAPAVDRGRTAFVIGCMLLLVGGLLGLLLINTALAQGSFTLHDLQQRSDELGDQQQALRQDIDAQAAPERLAARAKALGMVPSQGAAFVRLPDGRLLGVAKRATPAPTPTVKAHDGDRCTDVHAGRDARPSNATKPTKTPDSTPRPPPGPRERGEGGRQGGARLHPCRRREPGARPAPAGPAHGPAQPAPRARGRPTSGADPRPAQRAGRASRQRGGQPPAAARPVRRPRLGHPQRRARAMFIGVCFVLSLFAVQLLRLQALDASAMAEQALGSRLTTVPVTAPARSRSSTAAAWCWPPASSATTSPSTRRPSELLHEVREGPGHRQEDARSSSGSPAPPPRSRRCSAWTSRPSRPSSPAPGASPTSPRASPPRSGARCTRSTCPGSTPSAPPSAPTRRTASAPPSWASSARTTPRSAGLELKLNKLLTGTPGSQTYERDPQGRQIPTGDIAQKAAVPGSTVQLTLDRDLQWKAEQALAAKVKESGALSGTVVVMTVDGKILALANAPTFDPNVPAQSKPANLSNRALSEVYEPGSTSKVMTAAAALEEGAVTPTTPVLGARRRSTGPARSSTTRTRTRVGAADVRRACWPSPATSARSWPARSCRRRPCTRYLNKFGIGQPVRPGLPRREPRHPRPAAGLERLAALHGAVRPGPVGQRRPGRRGLPDHRQRRGAGRSRSWWPARVDADGTLKPAAAAQQTTRVVSAKTAATLRRMLEGVVSQDGTAPEAKIAGYRVAGKTGTAQRFDPTCGCYRGYTGSFIGMAPADDPQLIVAVTLQRPVRGYFGGTVAAPVFKDVMTYALQKMQIPPTGVEVAHDPAHPEGPVASPPCLQPP